MREEIEQVPCICCMMSNQQDNGFCARCNVDGCPRDPYWTNGPEPTA